jgi:MFS-type transporter involved in bile tolerance (Atg22 family)
LLIGAWADYGTSRPNITIFFTILAVAVSFAWLGVEDADQWRSGVALYILGCEHSIYLGTKLSEGRK